MGDTRKRPLDQANLSTMDTISIKKQPPYDPSGEKFPLSVTQRAEWAQLVKALAEVHHLLMQPFKSSNCRDHFTEILTQLIEQGLGQELAEIVLRISGAMGGGKSSTLNALFQVGTIAREGDAGRSCTLSSNLFCAPRKGQTTPFLAEVSFFEAADRYDILLGLVRDYSRACYGSDDDDPLEKSDDNPAIKEEVTSALLALFKDHQECQSAKEVRRFLEEADTEDQQFSLVKKLKQWSDSLIKQVANDGDKETVTLTASTAGDLLTKLEGYATVTDADDGSSGASLWPLVSLIRLHFDDPLTRLGITFLDTPGLTDMNRTRKLSALQHASKATHAMIVTDVARAQDDSSVSSEVKKMCRLGSNRVVVVSPKADRIGDTTKVPGTKRQKEELSDLQSTWAELQAEFESIETKIQDCDDRDDSAQSNVLNQRKRRLEVMVKYAENAVQAHRINMRSENTKTTLQDKLADIVKSGIVVPVFSVSNTAYAQHLAGYPPRSTPVLSVEATNVPEVRRLISTFPNEARLNEMRCLLYTVLPSTLSRLRLYTSRSSLERKSDLDKYVTAPEMQCGETIEAWFKNFGLEISERVVNAVRDEEQDWVTRAGALCTSYETAFTTAQFLALMRNGGHRRATPKFPRRVDLSSDLICLKSAVVEQIFRKVTQNLIGFIEHMKKEIDGLFTTMVHDLEEAAESSFMDIRAFIAFLYEQRPQLPAAIGKADAAVTDGIEAIRSKAIYAEVDAYLATAMVPIYEKVMELKCNSVDPVTKQKFKKPQKGWPALRRSTFRKEVTQIGGIWTAVHQGIKRDLGVLLQHEMSTLRTDITLLFQGFRTAFDQTFEVKDDSSPEEQELREALMKNLPKARDHLEGSMWSTFEKLRKDFH